MVGLAHKKNLLISLNYTNSRIVNINSNYSNSIIENQTIYHSESFHKGNMHECQTTFISFRFPNHSQTNNFSSINFVREHPTIVWHYSRAAASAGDECRCQSDRIHYFTSSKQAAHVHIFCPGQNFYFKIIQYGNHDASSATYFEQNNEKFLFIHDRRKG